MHGISARVGACLLLSTALVVACSPGPAQEPERSSRAPLRPDGWDRARPMLHELLETLVDRALSLVPVADQ